MTFRQSEWKSSSQESDSLRYSDPWTHFEVNIDEAESSLSYFSQQMSDHLNEKVKEQASEIIELRKMLLEKDEELDSRADEVRELRRQLEERDKRVEQMFANNKLCAVCSHKLVNPVEEMDTGWPYTRVEG